jgi:hypothetical protein
MGQSKRRKQMLGDLYWTPEARNSRLVVIKGSVQAKNDAIALVRLKEAMSTGQPVTLIGSALARPLAAAAGIQWLHELPTGEPIPSCIAWDAELAVQGGPMLPAGHAPSLVVLGAGSAEFLEDALKRQAS